MPRWIASTPLPSGDGSPSTTLRMSATRSGSGRSRPQFDAGEVIVGVVGAADEVAHRRDGAVGDRPGPAARGRQADRPEVAGLAAKSARISASVAKRKPSRRPGSLPALTSLSEWSPRTSSSQIVVFASAPASSRVVGGQHQRLHRPLAAAGRASAATSSQVLLPGVGVFVQRLGGRRRAARPGPAPRPARCWRRSRESGAVDDRVLAGVGDHLELVRADRRRSRRCRRRRRERSGPCASKMRP